MSEVTVSTSSCSTACAGRFLYPSRGGIDAVDAIEAVETDSTDKPRDPVVIESAELPG